MLPEGAVGGEDTFAHHETKGAKPEGFDAVVAEVGCKDGAQIVGVGDEQGFCPEQATGLKIPAGGAEAGHDDALHDIAAPVRELDHLPHSVNAPWENVPGVRRDFALVCFRKVPKSPIPPYPLDSNIDYPK